MSEKRACDAVYVATVAEELRNIEKTIAVLEIVGHPVTDESASQIPPLAPPEDLPDAEWIHRKARELRDRLRNVEQTSTQEKDGDATSTKRPRTPWRAVPRHPKMQ